MYSDVFIQHILETNALSELSSLVYILQLCHLSDEYIYYVIYYIKIYIFYHFIRFLVIREACLNCTLRQAQHHFLFPDLAR